MKATVHRLHADQTTTAEQALAVFDRHLNRCGLATKTVKAYWRQATAFVDWLVAHVRHEAPFHRVEVRELHRSFVAARGWSRGQPVLGDAGRGWEAALTKPELADTAR